MSWLFTLVTACWSPQNSAIRAQQSEGLIPLVSHPSQLPMTWVQVSVRAGSGYDPSGKEGVAYLTANMLAKGGTASLTPTELEQELTDLAAPIQVVVDKEQVSFRMTVLNEQLEDAAEIFRQTLLEPRWDEKYFDTMRANAHHRLVTQLPQQTERLGLDVFDSWVFSGHPYGHSRQGRLGVLQEISLSDVKAFFSLAYRKASTAMGVSGAMVSRSGGLEADHPLTKPIRHIRFGLSKNWSSDLSHPETHRHVQSPEGREVLIVESTGESVGIHVGHPTGLHRGHPDWPAMQLAMTAFGAHRQSFGRLYKSLREQRGLTYGCYAYVEDYRQAGGSRSQETGTGRVQNAFSIWLRPVSVENAGFGLRAIIAMLDSFIETGLEEDEFEIMQSYLAKRTALWAKSPGRMLGWMLEARLMGWSNPIRTLPPAVTTLDRTRVNETIKRHLQTEDLKIVLVTKEIAKIQSQIEENSNTIVYTGEKPQAGSETAIQDDVWARYPLEVSSVTVQKSKDVLQ